MPLSWACQGVYLLHWPRIFYWEIKVFIVWVTLRIIQRVEATAHSKSELRHINNNVPWPCFIIFPAEMNSNGFPSGKLEEVWVVLISGEVTDKKWGNNLGWWSSHYWKRLVQKESDGIGWSTASTWPLMSLICGVSGIVGRLLWTHNNKDEPESAKLSL